MPISQSKIQTQRQYWMSIIAKSTTSELLSLSQQYVEHQVFNTVRAAEVGLTQVRGRMGGTGSQFNIGDMTITRCVVQSALGLYGYGYITGRNKPHATRAAQLDAMLQDTSQTTELIKNIITPLAEQLQQKTQAKAREVDQTKVNFFTLVRGED